MIIRMAGPDDFEAVIPPLLDFYREVGVAPIHPPSVCEAVARLLAEEYVVIALDGKAVVGALGLCRDRIWYSQAYRLINAFFYVDPGQRAGDVGTSLLGAAKQIAEETSSLLEIDVINRGRRRGRVASKFGFVPVGYLTSFGIENHVSAVERDQKRNFH